MLCSPLGGAEIIKKQLLKSIHEYLLTLPSPPPRSKKAFDQTILEIRRKAKGIGYETLTILEQSLRLHNSNLTKIAKNKDGALTAIKKELYNDGTAYFTCLITDLPYERFRNYPRYLKAFDVRIDRAFHEPMKYQRNRALLETYRKQSERWNLLTEESGIKNEIEKYNDMIEEFAISLFAQQEVKTRFPVSEKRLEKMAARIEDWLKKRTS
jgi:ATP-dependent helicase HrpA